MLVSINAAGETDMPRYRHALPQLSGQLFLTDAGLETDIIYNHGIELPEFAAHTLLEDPFKQAVLAGYLTGYLELARQYSAGFILDTPTWKAHPHWAADLGLGVVQLRDINEQAVAFIRPLRDQFSTPDTPVVLNGLIGPFGDAYAPETRISAGDAQAYHAQQVGWMAQTDIDMVTAMTISQADEAIGIVRAASHLDLPVAVSFTVETDGQLPDGQSLADAIKQVDAATDAAAVYFMINCAHPDHFSSVLTDASWARRIRGVRCNASRLSHAELDVCETLDCGDPAEFAQQNLQIHETLPWLNIFGGCCGSDLRHVTAIARALSG
jgi:S-methylmethionine-dependent homocysteine/selenocysteine methylase